jgi:hypothetical protein
LLLKMQLPHKTLQLLLLLSSCWLLLRFLLLP